MGCGWKGSGGLRGRLSRGLHEHPDLPVGTDPQGESPLAGLLEGRRGVLPGQGQESQTAPIGLLGMTAGGEERLHHLSRGLPDPAGPLEEAFRTPAAHGLVGLGHVGGQRGVTAGSGFCITPPRSISRERATGSRKNGNQDSCPHIRMNQKERLFKNERGYFSNPIKGVFFIPIDRGRSRSAGPPRRGSRYEPWPFSTGPPRRGRRQEDREPPSPGEEEVLSRSGATVLERTSVEFLEKEPDRPVQGDEVEEGPLPKFGQDPAGHQLDRLFSGSLVLWTSDARRENRHRIMLRHLPVGFVDEGLIEIGSGDPAFEIVRNQEGGNPAQECKAADMGTDPAGQLLTRHRFGKDIVRKPQDGDEDLGVLGRFSCPGIPDRHGAPGIVDKEPVPRGVGVPVGRLQALGIVSVMLAEAGVGISPLLDRLPVLFPEKQEGDTLVALKLPMDLVPVRFDPGRGCRSLLLLQDLGQERFPTRLGQGPGNRLKLLEILGDGRGREGQALCNGPSRHSFFAGQP